MAIPYVHSGEILEKIEKLNNNTKEISEETLVEHEIEISAQTIEGTVFVQPDTEPVEPVGPAGPPCESEPSESDSFEKPLAKNVETLGKSSVRLKDADIDNILARQRKNRKQARETNWKQSLRSIELVKRLIAVRSANNGEEVLDERTVLPRPPYFQEKIKFESVTNKGVFWLPLVVTKSIS